MSNQQLPLAEPIPDPPFRRAALWARRCWARVGLSWRLWALALLVTWVLFVAGNVTSTAYHFGHLDRPGPPDLGEWQRLSRVADGATRRERQMIGQLFPPAALLPNVAVVSGPHTRLYYNDPTARQGGRLRLTPAVLDRVRKRLDAELDGLSPAGEPGDPLERLVALRLDLLALRHKYLGPEHRAALRRVRAADAPAPLREVAGGLWKAEGEVLTEPPNAHATVWTLDPWALSPEDLGRAVARGEQAVKEARQWLGANVPAREAGRDDDYHRELNRLVPLEPNPHLELFVPPADRPRPAPPPAGFTVVYFPPDRGAPPTPQARPKPLQKTYQAVAGPAAVVTRDPVEEPAPPPPPPRPHYIYCLEVTPGGGWRGGWGIDARFTLLAPDTPLMPIRQAGEPVTRVLSRGPGWRGFRPVAVRVTEEQLADRFFPTLAALSAGARTLPNDLVPDENDAKPVVAFVRRLLEARLGQPAAGPTDPPQSFAAQGDPDRQFGTRPHRLDEWVEWPRRFNGGTGWGVIQFAVTLLAVRFAIEWLIVYRLVGRAGDWRAGRAAPPPELTAAGVVRPGGPPQPLIDWLRVRTHTLRGIVAILPVVGFLGTVAGLSNSLIGSSGVSSESPAERQAALQAMEVALGTAFDKSMLAFAAVIACLTAERWLSWRIGQVR